MQIRRKLNDFPIGMQTFSQTTGAVGDNHEVFLKERSTEDILGELASITDVFSDRCDQHAGKVSFVGSYGKANVIGGVA